MMPYSMTMDSLPEEMPDPIRELYSEREGKWHLTGITGAKSEDDITRLKTALEKEREDHKGTKEKLGVWGDHIPDDVFKQLDRIKELEIAAKGDVESMDTKLEELAEARTRSRIAPIERENKTLAGKLETALAELKELKDEKIMRTITDAVQAEATKAKVRPEAMPDVLLLSRNVFEVGEDGSILTRENPFGIPAGLGADSFFAEAQVSRAHWWPESVGGGAKGSGSSGSFANNPWKKESFNLTKQGEIVKDNPELAKRMAKAAGLELTI